MFGNTVGRAISIATRHFDCNVLCAGFRAVRYFAFWPHAGNQGFALFFLAVAR